MIEISEMVAEVRELAAEIPVRKRKSRAWDPELLALKRFAKAVEKMDQGARRANIGWLTDKYLGIRL